MAWYNGGNWEGVPFCNLGYILAQLQTACNERKYPKGSIVGASTYNGYNRYQASQSVLSIRSEIENIISQFYNWVIIKFAKSESDQSIITNLSDLLSLGSYGSSWISIGDNVLNTNIYLQIREALELLIYPIYYPTELYSNDLYKKYGDSYVSWDDAWNDLLSKFYDYEYSGSDNFFIYSVTWYGAGYYKRIELYKLENITLDMRMMRGDILDSYLYMSSAVDSGLSVLDNITTTVGGYEITIPAGGTYVQTTHHTGADAGWIDFGNIAALGSAYLSSSHAAAPISEVNTGIRNVVNKFFPTAPNYAEMTRIYAKLNDLTYG